MNRDDQDEAPARQGLRAWAGFPADRQPRPLVLLGSAARPRAFANAQQKLAFLNGAIEAVPGFPAPVLQALRGRAREHAGPPLLVTAATLGQAEFATDRGRQQLPAWDVRAQDVPEPIWVLDPAVSQLAWTPPGQELADWRTSTAALSADGRTLTMSWFGSPRAYTDYPGANVLEAGAAVAIVPVRRELSTGLRTAHAERREVTVVLERPLGRRVLLDAGGSPVMVSAGG